VSPNRQPVCLQLDIGPLEGQVSATVEARAVDGKAEVADRLDLIIEGCECRSPHPDQQVADAG
jgi:hypothetical protein